MLDPPIPDIDPFFVSRFDQSLESSTAIGFREKFSAMWLWLGSEWTGTSPLPLITANPKPGAMTGSLRARSGR